MSASYSSMPMLASARSASLLADARFCLHLSRPCRASCENQQQERGRGGGKESAAGEGERGEGRNQQQERGRGREGTSSRREGEGEGRNKISSRREGEGDGKNNSHINTATFTHTLSPTRQHT